MFVQGLYTSKLVCRVLHPQRGDQNILIYLAVQQAAFMEKMWPRGQVVLGWTGYHLTRKLHTILSVSFSMGLKNSKY